MRTSTYNPTDLEVIVTSLELAAIHLTNHPGEKFTFEQLFTEALTIVPDLDERDVRIVMPFMKCLARDREGLHLR